MEVKNTPPSEPGVFEASHKDILRCGAELGRDGGDYLTGSEFRRHVVESVDRAFAFFPDHGHMNRSSR